MQLKADPLAGPEAPTLNRKVFQDFANTLPQMLVGWRTGDDLETLAELPDGTLSFDVLSETATHSVTSAIALRVAEEMQAWIASLLTTFHQTHSAPRRS